jgi:hypothetical protein
MMAKAAKIQAPTPPIPPPPPINPLHDLTQGYPRLAGRMGIIPETGMSKRFGALNARNFLYMQNELMFLEAKLKLAEAADAATPNSDKQNYRRDFWCMMRSEHAGPDTVQLNLVKQIRTLLKEYSGSNLPKRLNLL